MSLRTSCALCALLSIVIPVSAYAEPFQVTVPIGQKSSPTSKTFFTAQEEIKAIPGGADVVPASDFQNGYALTVKDMLATTPGVLAQPRWGEESRLSIRGPGLPRSFHMRGITLLQDGVPFNFADGSSDFQEIDPLVLQHVEVYRGGNGLRYGAATLGGAVNLVTPTARTVDYNTLLRAEGGSDKTLRLHAQAAKVFEGADVLAAVTRTASDGYRQQSAQENERFYGNAGIRLGQNAETRFYLTWNDIDQEVPGTLSKQDALNNPTSVSAANITGDQARDIRSVRVANRTTFTFDNGLELEAGGYVNDKDLYHPIFQVVDQDSVDIGGFTRLKGRYELSGYNHDFTVGAKVGRGVNDAKRFVNVRGRRGALTADGKQTAENIELFGENRFYMTPSWSLLTGLQGTIANREYEGHLNAGNNDEKIYRSPNPKIGIIHDIDPNIQAFANITRSSEAPTYSELVQGAIPGFVSVDQQSAWTAEIGTRGTHSAFSWDVTLYHAQVRDELLNFTVTPDVPASTFNADKTIHQGIELGLGWQATDTVSLNGVYTFNDFRFDGDAQFGDNDLAGAPAHNIRLSTRYAKNGFYIEPNVEWVPQAAWVDYANTLKADNYALVGLKTGVDVGQNVSLFFDARNLTDEKTIASFSTITDARTTATNVFYPNDGRSFFAGVSVKF